jgi:formamidopyrimidine-DNA glycosylase
VPELPEVETVKRGLEGLILHKKIARVTHDTDKSFPNDPHSVMQFLIGAKILAVRRRAKVLIIDLSTDYSLMIHLKMTGQLVFVGAERFGAGHPNDSLIDELPNKSTRVIFEFYDGTHLYFNDQRKFGWVKLFPTSEINHTPFMKKLGPEPLLDDFTADIFYRQLQRRSNTTIKAAILDQSVIAGVGNIYADEALWGARIHPATLVKNLTKKHIQKLYEEIRYVLHLSIEKGGSTDKNYVNAEGKKGSYIDFARVFRREGQLCPHCQSEITKIKVAARGTHICQTCQKVKRV